MYKLLKDYFCFTVYNTLSLEEIPDLTLVCWRSSPETKKKLENIHPFPKVFAFVYHNVDNGK